MQDIRCVDFRLSCFALGMRVTFLHPPFTPYTPRSSLFHGSFVTSYSAIGGIAFNILATSFGAIWLFCILRT